MLVAVTREERAARRRSEWSQGLARAAATAQLDASAVADAVLGRLQEFEQRVLGWGSQMEVLEPLTLRRSILDHAAAIVARG